jgi:histidine triad (HIT) family protein
MTTYDDQNVFAKILRGELPAHKIYEDDKTIAIMDIMPRADGHALVIPKAASRNILDISADDLAAVHATVQKLAQAAARRLAQTGLPSSSSTKVPAVRWSSTPMCTSFRAMRA